MAALGSAKRDVIRCYARLAAHASLGPDAAVANIQLALELLFTARDAEPVGADVRPWIQVRVCILPDVMHGCV